MKISKKNKCAPGICLESDPKNAEQLRGNNWTTILKRREGDSNVSVSLRGFKKLQFNIQDCLSCLKAAQHF